MKAKERFKERIKQLHGYKMIKETPSLIEMYSEEEGTVILSIDPKLNEKLSKIEGIKINKIQKEYYKGTKDFEGYMDYTIEFEIKNRQFKWNTFLFTNNYRASENYSVRRDGTWRHLYKKELSNEEKNILDQIKEITRKQLKGEKYFRLRHLFNPIQFVN